MIFEHRDYRTFLKTTLSAKSNDRNRYSLRAFSEKLGISTSFLSEVINAKKGLSLELAFKIALKLGLTDLETQYFCLLVQLEQEKDPNFREELLSRLSELNPKRKSRDLSVDIFKSISDWHHSAILELPSLSGFSLTAESAAKALGITKLDASVAIDRLLRLELLEKDEDGRLQRTENHFSSEIQVPNAAIKSFHAQNLAKAAEALHSQTPDERISATDVLAIDSKYLKQVDRLSREFSAAVLKLSDKSKVKDSVYSLAVQFFRLSKSRGKN